MLSEKKIIFLVPYPLSNAPSQRFRVELFLPVLQQVGLKFSIHPFLDKRTWKGLYQNGGFLLKLFGILKGFVKRWTLLFVKIPYSDYVFIHREAAPLGPPIFEWIIAKLYRKKIIYDFDDAIWIPNTSSANYFSRWFKAPWKVKYICRWSYKIVVGNDYLSEYASQFNRNVIKIPTCVDAEKFQNKNKENKRQRLNIGWTGSHSTLKYLDEIVPLIRELQKYLDFNFIVIADQAPSFTLKNLEFVPWKASTEGEDLSRLDIGIMPLVADAWSEGKCGFKLIQYFACNIPAIASPVGVNKTIIDEGVNGFLCSSAEEWRTCLQKLLADESLRESMGTAGRRKVEKFFSIVSQSQNFILLFS
jgi:glycosyltransferase involved in cell wall biosynthesis